MIQNFYSYIVNKISEHKMKINKTIYIKAQTKFYLAFLLFWQEKSKLCFCLIAFLSPISFKLGLAINRAKFIKKKIVISLVRLVL